MRHSLYLPVPKAAKHNRDLQKVYREIERREPRGKSYCAADAALLFVGYGTVRGCAARPPTCCATRA